MRKIKIAQKKEKMLTRKKESSHAVRISSIRKDGMTVYYDGDEILDEIRRHGTKVQVIAAVALRRAQEIAFNYARKYAPELLPELMSASKESPLSLPYQLEGASK